MTTFREQLHQEVHNNFVKFQAMEFDESQRGYYALMRRGKVVEILPNKSEARKLGRSRFPDGLFSFQKIMEDPIDLGFRSHI